MAEEIRAVHAELESARAVTLAVVGDALTSAALFAGARIRLRRGGDGGKFPWYPRDSDPNNDAPGVMYHLRTSSVSGHQYF